MKQLRALNFSRIALPVIVAAILPSIVQPRLAVIGLADFTVHKGARPDEAIRRLVELVLKGRGK